MVLLPCSALPVFWAVVASLCPLHAVSNAQVTVPIAKASFFNAISVLWPKRRSACLLGLGYDPPDNTDRDPYRPHAPALGRGRVLHPESAPNGGVA